MADSLVSEYPDSASVLLDQLRESILQEPQATRMYYLLLTIKAKEDHRENSLSDSLIKPLLEYYEKRKDKKQLPEVYYYAGKTYRELGDTPQAQDYLQKALKASEKDADHRLLYKIHRQLAMTYHHNLRRPAESIAPFKNACRHAVLSGDSLLMANALRDIARGFQNVNIDSLSFYYQKTIDMARQMHNDNLRSIVYIELGQCYFQERAYQKACDALQASHNPLMLPSVYYLARANVFNETGRPDSARYYAEKVLSTGNTYANIDAYYSNRQKAYSLLSTITAKQGNPAKALEYMRHCLMYDDSLQE
ncbi:tetratricopeptide repeat protein, partial [Bacteroides heparinolyticus]